jgi:hypothetical protein
MKLAIALLLLAAVGLAGCGGRPVGPSSAPLSVAEWKAMPVGQKYTADTLERLKAGDPKLGTPEGWEAFSRTTLREARKNDFPASKRRP